MGIQKRLNFLVQFSLSVAILTSMARVQNLYYVKINLCSTYVNEMSIKSLKKYLSGNLLKYHFIREYHCHVRFYFIEYNHMFNAIQERND